MKHRSNAFVYLLAVVLLVVAACFISACDGCDDGEDTTEPASTSTIASTTEKSPDVTTSTTKVNKPSKDPDGDGWITDKDGNPAIY